MLVSVRAKHSRVVTEHVKGFLTRMLRPYKAILAVKNLTKRRGDWQRALANELQLAGAPTPSF